MRKGVNYSQTTAGQVTSGAVIAGLATGITQAAYGSVAVLTSTGVGIPLAGAIAGALLIANKLANLYKKNKKLFPIMADTINILSSCYKLNALLDTVYTIFIIYMFNTNAFNSCYEAYTAPECAQKGEGGNSETDEKKLRTAALLKAKKTRDLWLKSLNLKKESMVTEAVATVVDNVSTTKSDDVSFATDDILATVKNNKIIGVIHIDIEIQQHIKDKIELLLKNLLKTATPELLTILEKDTQITSSGFSEIVAAEIEIRKARNYASKISASVDRAINRTFYASDIKDDITDNLSIINGYFMTLKTNYDFALELYERYFKDDWLRLWKTIEKTEEFIQFMVPTDNKALLNAAVNNNIEGMNELAKEVVTNTSFTNNEAPTIPFQP